MAQDPFRARKADRWDALVNSGVSPDEATRRVESEFASSTFTTPPQPAAPRAEAAVSSETPAPTQRLRSLAQGVTMGLSDEAEAAIRSLLPGQTYESAIQDVRGKLAAYRDERPLEAMGMEVLGGLTTGLAGGSRALAATAGRAGLREAAKAAARVAGGAALKAPVQGAISGAAGAEGSLLTEQGLKNRAMGAVVGGTVGTVLPFAAGRAMTKLPVAKQISEGIGEAYTAAQRGGANLLERIGFGGTGKRFIAPTDALRIQQAAAGELPGSVTGPTTASMQTGREAATAAVEQARIAAQQGRLTAQQAAAARSKAEREARDLMRQVRQEEGALGSLASQKAAALRETGAARAERLAGASKASGTVAKEIKRAATAESRQAERMVREQAKEAAESTLREIEEEAAGVIGGLRGAQPRGTASQLQDQVRAKQLAEGRVHYKAIEDFGAPPDPDPEIYREILSTPSLRNAYTDALEAIRQSAQNATPGAPVRTPPRMITIGDQEMPEVTLEVMDEMRRRIVSPQMRKGPDVVGLSRSEKNRVMDTISRLEDRYLAGFGSDEAMNTLRTARGAYREKFQILEAVQDGLNLGTVKAGKASGLLTQSRKELDEVVKRVETMSPEQKAAFQVGAREWFDRLAQETPDEALKIARKFSSEASQRRLALAYGNEAVEALRAFTPKAVGARTQAAAAQARTEAQSLAQQIAQRGRAEALPLEQRAARAAELGAEAKAAKASRAEQLLAQREAAATQRIEGTRRTAQEQVGAARQASRAASDEATRLAEALTQSRIARTQTQALPVRDLDRALKGSTDQQVFLQRLLPQMNPAQRTEAVSILGSNIQRELQDMARTGKTPQQILQRVNELQQNDAVRTLFGPQMTAFVRNLTPTAASRLPGTVRPAITGLLSRRAGANYNE